MPTPAPLVSVVVPAYNAARFLPDAIASVRRQTWRHLEVIIADDGSTDPTAAVAERLAGEDARIRVIHGENRGPSAARNAALAVAGGELLCFLDADDVFLPDKIERQAAFLELFPSCDLVYSDHYLGDEMLTPLLLECKRPPAMPMDELLSYCNWFAPLSPLFRRRLLEATGGFDESLRSAEDWDYWIRASRGGRFSYLPGPVGVYRTHPGQAHHDAEKMNLAQETVIRKHYAPGSREWHAARAVRGWSSAKRWWSSGRYFRTAASLCECVWYARSRRALKNVVDLAY